MNLRESPVKADASAPSGGIGMPVSPLLREDKMANRYLKALGFTILIAASMTCSSVVEKADFDLLIRGGRVVNGTGNPWFYADVGIRGDTIVEIGDLRSRGAAKVIEARGLVVSPGFIDLHTHCDRGLGEPRSKANLNYLIQGTTTVVTGNCGGGTHEVARTKALWEGQGIGTNAVHMVGFGDVREKVIGVEPRSPSAEELEKMKGLVRQAMGEGAWGMSTGLEYIPDLYSTTEEIIAIAKVVAEHGGVYLSHQRNEVAAVAEATRETIRIAEEAGLPVEVSHFKVCGKKNWGTMKEAVDVINAARVRGVPITADLYSYDKAATGPLISIARNSGWSIFRLPEDLEPFARLRQEMAAEGLSEEERGRLKDQYVAELAKALNEKTKRDAIRQSVLVGTPTDPSPVAVSGWDSYAVVAAQKNTSLIGKIFSDLAEEQKRDPFDLAAELVIAEPDLYLSCGALSEDDMKEAMQNDWLSFSSDGGAAPALDETTRQRPGHPRSFGSQARVLRKYVREEAVLTLEQAVRKMTSLPAQFLKLKKRGLLAEGFKADIAVFNPDTVRDNATYATPLMYSTGVESVILNGKVSVEGGRFNGSLNGRMLLLTENK
ncbi:MAG: dihydroorotase [Candidatus Aminicenantes bacterium]|nr:dihydroorotase [Candidatus Aminicenantes bacterium]